MEKRLILLRGIPGSGKTTFAEETWPDFLVLEADKYFYDKEGNYNFDASKLGEAHRWCRDQVEIYMQDSLLNDQFYREIIVSNTFIKEWEMAAYFELAKKYGYRVFSLVVEKRHGGRNVHGIEDSRVEKMKREFQSNINLKFTRELLEPYLKAGLVEANRHPSLPLTIYNYSRECQYASLWDEVTLRCRGLIIDDQDVIVASGFDKFFNWEEAYPKGDIPFTDKWVWIQEKMDGSLGILFYYAGDWHLATRGSFASDQAVRGMEILKRDHDLLKFNKEAAYICEIIYPENRIVVTYEGEKIVFLSVMYKMQELSWAQAKAIMHSSGIKAESIVKTHYYETLSKDLYTYLKDKEEDNKEGFVLRFYPSNYRVKVKFEEYVRLHRILTEISNLDIWQGLMDEKEVSSIVKEVPDEFDQWVKDWESALKFAWVMQKRPIDAIYEKLKNLNLETRKDQALWIEENVPSKEDRGIIFSMLNGHDENVRISIWKRIRPEYQRPFWQKDQQ